MLSNAFYGRGHARPAGILPVLEEAYRRIRPISGYPPVLPPCLSADRRKGHRAAAARSAVRGRLLVRCSTVLHSPLLSPSAVCDPAAERAWRPPLRPQWQVTQPRRPWSAGAVVPPTTRPALPGPRPARPCHLHRRLHRGVRAGRRQQQRRSRGMRAEASRQPAADHRCLTVPARLTVRQTARVHVQTERRPTQRLKLAH